VLIHGAQLDEESGEFHAPSVSFEDSHSELPQCVSWSKNAALHKESKSDSSVIGHSYDEQLTLLEPSEASPINCDWVKVRTRSGKIGFMSANDVYSAFDEFAVFKKRQQKWYLTWFGYAAL
jgi:hypothetical protein